MKRLHVNLGVTDLDASVRFYTALFHADPTVLKSDYARWMLDDPRVNFAISTRSGRKGVDHLGIQAESDGELAEMYGRLGRADAPVVEQGETVCCYARSDKRWIFDPEGTAWEAFLTHGDSPVYGAEATAEVAGVCCATTEQERPCCG